MCSGNYGRLWFLSDLSLLSYKFMAWIWSMEGVCTMWLSELGTFAMFWGLKTHSITETDILWYDLREYVCWFWHNARIISPSVLWPSLTPIMDYPLYMPHDLATANRHDHAWTENWDQTSVRCTNRCPSCGQDMRIEKVIGGATSTGRKVD